MSYEFEHSVECPAAREFAWGFWSDLRNWTSVDPALESVTVDGPFAAGARGETRPRGQAPVSWRLAEVSEGRGATFEVAVPGAALRFAWTFEEAAAGGTRVTQRVTLGGDRAGEHLGGMKMLEQGIPVGMRRLAEAIANEAGRAA